MKEDSHPPEEMDSTVRPGDEAGSGGTEIISQKEIYDLLEEFYRSQVYRDDPDHPHNASQV